MHGYDNWTELVDRIGANSNWRDNGPVATIIMVAIGAGDIEETILVVCKKSMKFCPHRPWLPAPPLLHYPPISNPSSFSSAGGLHLPWLLYSRIEAARRCVVRHPWFFSPLAVLRRPALRRWFRMCGCSSQRRKTTLKGLKMLASKTSSSKGEVQSGTLLGPKVEDVKKPVNPLVFFSRNEGETNEGVVVQDANDSMDIMFSQECVVAANPSGVETMVLASNTQEDPIVGHASPTDEAKSPRLVTEPVVKRRKLFRSPMVRQHESAPSRRSRATSSALSASRKVTKVPKTKFKVIHDMDFNWADTLLFNYLFSDGHSLDETVVRMVQYRLTRRHIQSLVPGRPIDGRVVEMVAEEVSKGLSTEELTETYVPFWIKPSRFVRCVNFIPIEEIFMHWYCMVVDYDMNTVYHLDSYLDPKMVTESENECQAFNRLLNQLGEAMGSPITIQGYIHIDRFGAWVISWLHPKRSFNHLRISGVLEDPIVQGTTVVSLVGGPFNAIGGLVRMWAQKWQSRRHP
ncbi:hypothetical protein Ahy_A03g010379 [Arachis hypogaea]|uniref:Ubiquitin-like protease family profile domain-containing protein n=1 Tax=Arachis hypogaea TaxID=3818 RepID=A0A445DM23_ARAHY|nr:hypothetical protein Ahy_A03g010379 [Arachis hypogaea]